VRVFIRAQSDCSSSNSRLYLSQLVQLRRLAQQARDGHVPSQKEMLEGKHFKMTGHVTSIALKATGPAQDGNNEEDVAMDMRVAKVKSPKSAKTAKTGMMSAKTAATAGKMTLGTAGKVVKKAKRTGPLAVASSSLLLRSFQRQNLSYAVSIV
jgi:hypothetical protein